MAHENPDPRFFFGDISFDRKHSFFGQLTTPVIKQFAALRTGAAGGKNRLRDIGGPIEGAADKNSGARGFHRIYRVGIAKIVRIEFDAELIRQTLCLGRRIQPDG